MLEIKLDRQQSRDFLNFLKNGDKSIQEAIRTALFRIGLEIRNKASRLAPVKSGTLRRSLSVFLPAKVGDTHRVLVGTDLVYAAIHDKGGFIRPHTATLTQAFGRTLATPVRVQRPGRYMKAYQGRGYLTPAFRIVTKQKGRAILNREISRIFR